MRSLKELLLSKENIRRIMPQMVCPKTKQEFKIIINYIMKKEGLDCNLNFIDISLIDDMSYLFPYGFCGDVSGWDVSNVKNMEGMFYECEDFNCDISGWDVSNVKYMSRMFCGCKKFNCDLSGWDVSNVKDMRNMFKNCPAPIPEWYK